MIVSTVMNFLIVWLSVRNNGRQDSTTILLANMSLANMIACVVVTTIAIGRNISYNYELGAFGCNYITYFKDVTTGVPMISLALLAEELIRDHFRSGEVSNQTAYFKAMLSLIHI